MPAHMAVFHHLIKICWALWKQRQCLCLHLFNMYAEYCISFPKLSRHRMSFQKMLK